MPTFLADLRLAFRALLRRPGFTSVVVLTLALGIGANSAMFSVVNGVLLRPLPYRAPESLALIWSKWSNFDKTWISAREYFAYKQQATLFSDVAAWSDGGTVALTGDGKPESVETANVTFNLLDVLGVPLVRGRGIGADQDVPNGPRVALVSYGLWQRRFGGDPALVGRTIQLDGETFAVAGILPRGFRLPLEFRSAVRADILTPLGLDPASMSGNHGYYGVARLRPGVTAARVTAALKSLAERWTADKLYPPAMQFTVFSVMLDDEVSGGVRTALFILFGAVGMLLLISSSNVANLLLTRADARDREMAVRVALGAGSRRMMQTSLSESLLLALGGGCVGLVFAWGGVRILAAYAATSIPRADELGLDPRVVAFTLVLSIVTGLAFGAMPALRAARVNLAASLKEGGRGGSDSRTRLRGRALLVAAEMAVAVVLVIGAGLLVRSFRNVANIDPGFDSRNVATMRVSLPAATYPNTADLVRFYDRVAEDVRRLPGVRAAGFVRSLPLAMEIGDAGLAIEGRPVAQGEPNRSADWQVVTQGYFETMKTRLIKGRFFDASDSPDSPPVIMVNQALASQYFAGENPVGQRIRIGPPTAPWSTIIGVVADTRHNGILSPPKRQWYVLHSQFATSWGSTRRAMTLVVRTAGDPRAVVPALEGVIARADPSLPVTNVATLDEVVGDAMRDQRFATTLMTGFALLAMLLAAVGIYGVISYSVSQRSREIGVRLALGAEGSRVRRMVVFQGMGPAIGGIVAGLIGAAALSRTMAGILYGVGALDPLTFAVIPVTLLGVAFASTILPAVRATHVDPIKALRAE